MILYEQFKKVLDIHWIVYIGDPQGESSEKMFNSSLTFSKLVCF